MSQRDDAVVLDLLKASRLAVAFMGGLDADAFFQDLKTQASVQHQILLLGEGVKRLSMEFRATHSDVPWRAIAGMRDTLIHQYDDVDLDEIWRTVMRDIPSLIRKLERLSSQSQQ